MTDPTGVCGRPLTVSELRALADAAYNIARVAIGVHYNAADQSVRATVRDLTLAQVQLEQDRALLQTVYADVEARTIGIDTDAICGRVMTVWNQAQALPYNVSIADAITKLLYKISAYNKKYRSSGSGLGTFGKIALVVGLAGAVVFAVYKFTPVGRLR